MKTSFVLNKGSGACNSSIYTTHFCNRLNGSEVKNDKHKRGEKITRIMPFFHCKNVLVNSRKSVFSQYIFVDALYRQLQIHMGCIDSNIFFWPVRRTLHMEYKRIFFIASIDSNIFSLTQSQTIFLIMLSNPLFDLLILPFISFISSAFLNEKKPFLRSLHPFHQCFDHLTSPNILLKTL